MIEPTLDAPAVEAMGLRVRDLLWLGGLGLALVMVLGTRGRLLVYVPLKPAARASLRRAAPVLGALLGFMLAVTIVQLLFRGEPDAQPYAITAVFVGFVALIWPAARDFVAGVFVRSSGVCAVGDSVRVGDLEGRVTSLGNRVITLLTPDGEEAVIPYAGLSRESILRVPEQSGGAPHAFTIRPPAGSSLAAVKRLARHAAETSHYGSLVREAEVTTLDGGRLEITVFAIDADRGPDVETDVRAALAELEKPAAATRPAGPIEPPTLRSLPELPMIPKPTNPAKGK